MCINKEQFENLSTLTYPILVNLPDGSIRHVTKMGDVKLGQNFILKGVLYTPYFKFNLMSVNKVTECAKIKFSFFLNLCLLQDLKTEEVLAKAKVKNFLYVLDSYSDVSTRRNVDCNNSTN